LDENHVASDQAGRIRATSRVRPAVEHDGAVAVLRIAEDLVEENGKPVQMTNVKRAKIRVESVVEEGVVYREVHGTSASGSMRQGRTLARRFRLLRRIRERGLCIRRRVVRCEVKAICLLVRTNTRALRVSQIRKVNN
jgi:hypothetical protein